MLSACLVSGAKNETEETLLPYKPLVYHLKTQFIVVFIAVFAVQKLIRPAHQGN